VYVIIREIILPLTLSALLDDPINGALQIQMIDLFIY